MSRTGWKCKFFFLIFEILMQFISTLRIRNISGFLVLASKQPQWTKDAIGNHIKIAINNESTNAFATNYTKNLRVYPFENWLCSCLFSFLLCSASTDFMCMCFWCCCCWCSECASLNNLNFCCGGMFYQLLCACVPHPDSSVFGGFFLQCFEGRFTNLASKTLANWEKTPASKGFVPP